MRTKDERDHLREQAVALRRQDKSVRQIREALGPVRNATLTEFLRDVPPPEWTKRPNAKDALRAQARQLREEGLKYKDIAAKLHVSMSSVSLWVRDIPGPPRISPPKSEDGKRRSLEGFRQYTAREREAKNAKRAADIAAAAAEVGGLTDRELLIAGAIAYWCEGTKRKRPDDPEQVSFVNSDPGLIVSFLRFLDVAGVSREDLAFRVQIHETADVGAAEGFWREVTGARPDQFRKTNLKKHNPKTVRKNTGDDYHGCLRIDVRRSSGLYRRIEGWASGAMAVNSNNPQLPEEDSNLC